MRSPATQIVFGDTPWGRQNHSLHRDDRRAEVQAQVNNKVDVDGKIEEEEEAPELDIVVEADPVWHDDSNVHCNTA